MGGEREVDIEKKEPERPSDKGTGMHRRACRRTEMGRRGTQ